MQAPPCSRPIAITLALAMLAGCTGRVVTTGSACADGAPCNASPAVVEQPFQPGSATASAASTPPSSSAAAADMAQAPAAAPATATGARSPVAAMAAPASQAPGTSS